VFFLWIFWGGAGFASRFALQLTSPPLLFPSPKRKSDNLLLSFSHFLGAYGDD
jgi:hypothetical protein